MNKDIYKRTFFNTQKVSFGTNSIKILTVVLLFLSLLINNLSATISINSIQTFSVQKSQSSILVSDLSSNSLLDLSSNNLNKFNVNFVSIKQSEIKTPILNEIYEIFEIEIDDFLESFSKEYKFYNNFVFKSIEFDRFSLNQAKTIPLYILFQCLKIHLS